MDFMRNREPVVFAQLFQTLLVAVVGFVVAFTGWDPSSAQLAAMTGLYVALASVVTYALRGTVYAPSSVVQLEPEPENL